ncbi:ACP S-malonyltransferase [Marinobacteraceae bacterium S3BR75-40.1]
MKHAFVFPGQGSQTVGMLAEACEHWPIVRQTFSEASDVLGYDLEDLCKNGPEEKLNSTAVTQPALLTCSTALWRQWAMGESCQKPGFLAGHSLGEYSALVAAESLRFLDAVKLVRLRGELMQNAVPEGQGRMAAILGLADEEVQAACKEAAENQVVEAANFNAPGQVVIAGNTAAVDRAIALCKEKGAKRALPLAVSVPSHCQLMRDAAEELRKELEGMSFNDAVIPVVQNVSASSVTDKDALRDNLVQQLYSPVRWSESIQALSRYGVTHLVECGPGKVLSGLVKRIDRSMTCFGIETPEAMKAAIEALS